MNVDPLNPDNAPSVAELRAASVRWVRLVSRDDPAIAAYRDAVQAAGIMVLADVTQQSGGYVLPGCDAYQLGNEPDVPGTADSMSASDYVGYWNLYFNTYFATGAPLAGVPVIGAGLGFGQPSYWQQVQSAGGLHGASGFAVHPYAKTTPQARALLQAFQKITPSVPLWVTEWNRSAAEIPAFVQMLEQTSVMHAWFCWSSREASAVGIWPLDASMIRDLAASE